MKKQIAAILLIAFLIVGCKPSESTIQTAIVQTQIAGITPTWPATNTPKPTNTLAPTRTPKPTPTPNIGTLNNPIPFNTEITITDKSLSSKMVFKITVVEVLRGEEANAIVTNANMFNDPPPDGSEYIFVKVVITFVEGELEINYSDFELASKGNLIDAFAASVCCTEDEGYPELEANLIVPGAVAEGWIIFPVAIDEPAPLLVYGVGYKNDISEALFFSLK